MQTDAHECELIGISASTRKHRSVWEESIVRFVSYYMASLSKSLLKHRQEKLFSLADHNNSGNGHSAASSIQYLN